MDKFFENPNNFNVEKWYQTKYLNATMETNFLESLKKMDGADGANNYGFKLRPKNEYLTSYSNIVSCYDDKVFIEIYFFLFKN
jgi:hypothetical protein